MEQVDADSTQQGQEPDDQQLQQLLNGSDSRIPQHNDGH
jgi:hypothetical protein